MSLGTHVDFRQLRTVVAHPRDHDGELLIRHLQRLGCRVEHLWPPPIRLEAQADLVFCLVEQSTRELCSALAETSQGTLIGIIEPGNERAPQLLVDARPHAVLNKPFDAAVILTNIVVARNNSRYQGRLLTKIAKLEETLRALRKVERAKVILMEKRHIDESAAYEYLRDQAMKKRLTIGMVATAVIESDEVLSKDRG